MILYAIPTPIGSAPEEALPAPALRTIRSLKDFVVEKAKSARAFLGAVGLPVRELAIVEIERARDPLQPLREGRPLGLLAEAGCPAIADPGATVVEAAHREGFRVVPLVGPSSIILALAASGLQGQRFAFCGYLPREASEREKRIRRLEKRSREEDETEIFIETPYRNDALLGSLLKVCDRRTRLCVAADLTLPTETVRSAPVAAWIAKPSAIGKRPAVFLLAAR